jgi:hypothetical protein
MPFFYVADLNFFPNITVLSQLLKHNPPSLLNFDPLVLGNRTSGDNKIGDKDTGGNRDGGGLNKQQSTKSSGGNGDKNGDNDSNDNDDENDGNGGIGSSAALAAEV